MVTIYVLKLQGNKYYVGKTTNPTYRLDDHFSEGGSAWTKKYKPISIHELQPDKPDTDEQIVTQKYMQKYGIDNVRGGPWCKINLSEAETLRNVWGVFRDRRPDLYKGLLNLDGTE